MTLAEFLAARLDEDEAIAQAAIAEDPDGSCGCPPGDWSYRDRIGSRDDYGTLYHEMRHDPARMLRVVAAIRRILELHLPGELEDDLDEPRCQRCEESLYPCATARALGTIWWGHPDYDEAWRR